MEINDFWNNGVTVLTDLTDDDEGTAREEIENFVLSHVGENYEVEEIDFAYAPGEVAVRIARVS